MLITYLASSALIPMQIRGYLTSTPRDMPDARPTLALRIGIATSL